MNTKTYAFTPANDLAKIIEAAIITKADGIAILQARKERKLAKDKPFGGKSASLLASLLGLAPVAAPKPAVSAKAESPVDEQEAYAAKIEGWSLKQLACSMRKAHLTWKKELLQGEIQTREIEAEVDADLGIVPAVEASDTAFALMANIRSLNPTVTTSQMTKIVTAIMGANAQ